MRLEETGLEGLYLIHLEPVSDTRGFFCRTFCQDFFSRHSLVAHFVQNNLVWNRVEATIRGMHYQIPPHGEVKLVHCIRGAIHDVVIDLRAGSATYARWAAFDIKAEDHQVLYVPEGCAHGYQTLCPDTQVYYLMSSFYSPRSERGVRWNDPAFAIRWPLANPVLSPKDRDHPDFAPR